MSLLIDQINRIRQIKQDSHKHTSNKLMQIVNFASCRNYFASVRYLHIVPQLVREPDRSVGRYDDPYGGDFLEQIAKTPDRTRKSRLRRILSALRVAVPQLQDLELWRDPDRGTPHLRGKYVHWRPQGAWQTEEQFSDGTLLGDGASMGRLLDGSGPLPARGTRTLATSRRRALYSANVRVRGSVEYRSANCGQHTFW